MLIKFFHRKELLPFIYVDPKNPKLNLNVKIKNEPQDLNITICGFDDASLSTHFENYLTQLGDYLFELSAYSKIGDLYNKYVQNDIFNMDDFSKMNTDFVLGSQVFLSTNKSFKDMNQNDYLNLIENKIKSFGNNLTLDKLINAFNDGQIMGWGNNSSPDYSIILTPQEKQAINSKTLRFGVTSVNDLTSKVYNNYHFGSGLIDNLNINEGANLLSIGFKDNLYSSTTNWLVQENPKEISINEFIVYFASIFNNVLSSNNSILNSSIDIPKSLSFNEQIKWIDSQIYTCNLNGYNSRLYVYEIVLLSNFILHLYNYSLPANFDYYNLMFTINNNNQLVIKYKDSIEQPINLNVNLNGWNTISSNEYFKEFEASLSQLFNQNKIQLSKSKLELLKQEDTINNNNRDLKEHEYIIEQMFKVISSEAKLKIMSIYNSLKNVKDSYMFGEMCNPFIIAFNYNQAQNGNNFVKFQKDVKIGNKTFKVNITSKLWALNKNYYDSFYVTFTYNETTQKLNLKAKWNAMLIEQQIEINLPIELVD